MLYPQCNQFCDGEHDVHYLGRIRNNQAIDHDEFLFDAGRPCCGCGDIGRPHAGFTFPCPNSKTGTHYFTEREAELNAR